jgi:hypothetical protein
MIFYSGIGGTANADIDFAVDDKLNIYERDASSVSWQLKTNRLFRDVGAWYHIVIEADSTQATSSNRIKLYINGVQETSFDTATYPNQNINFEANNNSENVTIGRYTSAVPYYFNGYFSHYHFIDGTAYDASTFGQFNSDGVWTPKTSPSVTYGNNGYFLKFENSGSMGLDSSGNANNFTVNGTLTQTIDSPSNVYATLNPLDHIKGTFFNGNTVIEAITDPGDAGTRATLGFSQGKWYWEGKVNFIKGTGGSVDMIGILNSSATIPTAATNVPNGYGYNAEYGILYNGTTAVTSGLSTASNGDIYGVGYDADNGDLYLWKNGVAENSGNPIATGIDTSVTWLPYFVNHYGGTNSHSWQINIGNGYFGTTAVASAGSNGNGSIFEYDVPTGYYALNTKNLATYG